MMKTYHVLHVTVKRLHAGCRHVVSRAAAVFHLLPVHQGVQAVPAAIVPHVIDHFLLINFLRRIDLVPNRFWI